MASGAADYVASLEAQRQVGYCQVAALTFYAYDLVTTFDQEVQHVWGSRRSSVKVLYFIIRYSVIFYIPSLIPMTTSVNLTVEECRTLYWWMFISIPPFLHFFLDIVLVLRVSAIYNHSRQAFTLLLIFSFGNLALTLWTAVKLARNTSAGAIAIPPPWHGCISTFNDVSFALIVYIPNLVLSSIFLAMTSWKVMEIHRTIYGKLTWDTWQNMNKISPLMLTFLRGGGVYFVIVAIACSFSLISAAVSNEVILQGALRPWTFAWYSYAGSHLILDLRAAGHRERGDQSWNESLSTQSITGPVAFV